MNTGNPLIDFIGQIDCPGHFVPMAWFRTITRDNGKPYYTAIAVLSDIFTWYTPEPIYNNKGYVISYAARFDTEYLPRDYSEIASDLNVSKREVINAVVYLENKGILRRHFYSKPTVFGGESPNHLMLEIIPEGIVSIIENEEQEHYI